MIDKQKTTDKISDTKSAAEQRNAAQENAVSSVQINLLVVVTLRNALYCLTQSVSLRWMDDECLVGRSSDRVM